MGGVKWDREDADPVADLLAARERFYQELGWPNYGKYDDALKLARELDAHERIWGGLWRD